MHTRGRHAPELPPCPADPEVLVVTAHKLRCLGEPHTCKSRVILALGLDVVRLVAEQVGHEANASGVGAHSQGVEEHVITESSTTTDVAVTQQAA